MLTIRLIKRKPPRVPLLACTRADGSQTIAEMTLGAEHDLAHYAVETTLDLRDSFYSLLARGQDIQSFSTPAAARALEIPAEASWTEFVVGLLQTERRNSAPSTPDAFRAELTRTLDTSRRPIPPQHWPAPPTDGELDAIRAGLDELMRRWEATPEGASLTLEFGPRP